MEERSKEEFSFGFHWSKGKELIMVEKQWRLKKKQSKQAKGIKKNWGVWHVKEGELVVNVSK